MTDSYQHVLRKSEGHVLVVTFNRPEKLNAFDARMTEELLDVLQQAATDEEVRTVVLTGAGRGFCAGADVSGFGEAGGGNPALLRRSMVQHNVPLAQALMTFEKPLVAAVNGACAGAGLGIALACDLLVASSDAKFAVSFTRRGLVPDYGVTFWLPRIVGLRAARELCLLGETFPAQRADDLGLTTAVVEPDRLMDEALGYATRLADGAGIAIGLTKRLLQRSFEVDGPAALEQEFTSQSLCFATDDVKEGAASFLEKRPPQFTWS